MDYAQTKTWLGSLVIAMSGFDLGTIKKIVELSKLETGKLKAIHVAGSNGKGSTCAFISQILCEQGYKTGLYTSPHLIEETERIRVNGKDIPKKKFSELAQHYKKLIEKNSLKANYFEVTTAMAIKHFIDEKVDFAVIEVGMGGRLDATNILNGIVCAITSISLEHTQYLGNSVGKIAAEKAGIIKQGSTVVIAENNAGRQAIEAKAREKNAGMVYAKCENVKSGPEGNSFDLVSPENMRSLKTVMVGQFQCENASIAVSSALALRKKGFGVSDESIRKGVQKTFWRGRVEVVRKKPLVILDAAHNPDGWEKLFEALGLFRHEKLLVVFGVMADKDISTLKELLGRNAAQVIITKSSSERAEEPERIREKLGLGEIIPDPQKAIIEAVRRAGKDDLVLVTGSLYIIGEAYRALKIKVR